MLYQRASLFVAQEMTKTFKELLVEAIEAAKMTPTQFGERIMGRKKNGYQGFHDLVSGRVKVTPAKIAKITAGLGLPADYFNDPGVEARRKAQVDEAWAEFARSEVYRDSHPETLRILRAVPFTAQYVPTKQLYQTMALVIEGKVKIERASEAAAENEQAAELAKTLDRPSVKPYPKVTRKRKQAI